MLVKMKLPFSYILGKVLKPHFTSTKFFCKSPTFSISIPYTYVFSTLGLCPLRFTLDGRYQNSIRYHGTGGKSFLRKLPQIKEFVNLHHIKKHLGEIPISAGDNEDVNNLNRNAMLVHDLKIIATSLGLIQYTCLLVGCLTENPSLLLPHLAGQLVVICIRLLNAFLLLFSMNLKMLTQLQHKLTAIVLMTFNWLQEFCVFRQYLCVCDL